MNKIITAEELQPLKDFGKKIDLDKLNPIIEQAQDVELRDYLGMHFYFDVLANLVNEDYYDLLHGSIFNYDGIQYAHEGLRAMLVDLIYARYIAEINVNISPFGATVKLSPDSEPAPQAALKDKAHQNRQSAASKWEIIQLYLEQNKAQFSNYNYKANTTSTGERKLKFWRI